MNIKTNTNLVRSLLALTFALAIWSPVQSLAAEPAAGKTMTEGKMKECCQAMKEPPRFLVNDPSRWVITLQERGLVAGVFAAVVG